jgi:hypothetical protein
MSFSMTSLLIHSQSVPTPVREALESAEAAAPEDRNQLLESAARILHDETGLPCADVLELVGLPADGCCG